MVNAPVIVDSLLVILVIFVLPVIVAAPSICASLLIVVNVPAGSSVRLPARVTKLLPLNTKPPTPMLVGNINVLLTPSVIVSWLIFDRLTFASPKLTSPVR